MELSTYAPQTIVPSTGLVFLVVIVSSYLRSEIRIDGTALVCASFVIAFPKSRLNYLSSIPPRSNHLPLRTEGVAAPFKGSTQRVQELAPVNGNISNIGK